MRSEFANCRRVLRSSEKCERNAHEMGDGKLEHMGGLRSAPWQRLVRTLKGGPLGWIAIRVWSRDEAVHHFACARRRSDRCRSSRTDARAGVRRHRHRCEHRCRCERRLRAAAHSRIRTAVRAGSELRLGARLLGVGLVRILLGSRHVDVCAAARLPMDPRLLGLEQWIVRLEPRVLGHVGRLLRRRKLRRRILWQWVRRREMVRPKLRVQPVRNARRPGFSWIGLRRPERVREKLLESRQFQWWSAWIADAPDGTTGRDASRTPSRNDVRAGATRSRCVDRPQASRARQ